MKKQIILGSLLVFALTLKAQQWTTNGAGDLYNSFGGKVGINNPNPLKKLDVLLSIFDNYDGLKITHPNQNGNVGLFLKNSYSNNEWQIWSLAPNHGWSSGTNNFCIFDGSSSIPQFMIQRSNGNIGIGGSISPINKLEVITNITDDGISVTQTSNGSSALYLKNATANGHNWAIHSLGAGNPGGAGNFTIYDNTPGVNKYRLFIRASNGNVGIGTGDQDLPDNKLEVKTGAQHDGISVTQTSQGSCAIYMKNQSPGGKNWSIHSLGNGCQGGSGNFEIYDNSASEHRLFISGVNGNVGIGTTNPGTHKLAVEGKIGAREIFVTLQNPWPDYVFEKDYNLKSLEELEKYLTQNKHLPNIPSAEEMKKEEFGQNLGKIQALQMEKIEELTLYIIELKKEINELKKRD